MHQTPSPRHSTTIRVALTNAIVHLHAFVPVLLSIILVISAVVLGIHSARVRNSAVARFHIEDSLIAAETAVLVGTFINDQSPSPDQRVGLFDEVVSSMKYRGKGVSGAEDSLSRARSLIGTNLKEATEALVDFQFRVALEAFSREKENTFAPAYMGAAYALQVYTNSRAGWDLLHVDELDGPNSRHTDQRGASLLRLHEAAGLDVMCTGWFQAFKAFIDGGGPSSCFTTVGNELRQAITDNPVAIKVDSIPIAVSKEVNEYVRTQLDSYYKVLRRLREDHDSTDYAEGSLRIGLLCAIIAVCAIGILISARLIWTQRTFLVEQADIESEFQCGPNGVRMKRTAVRGIREICSHLAVLEPNMKAYDGVAHRQIELSLRRAAEPLSMLRAFVPQYMYQPSGITSLVEGLDASILNNSNLLEAVQSSPEGAEGWLNLTPNVKSTGDAMFLLVSLAAFNKGVFRLDDGPLNPLDPPQGKAQHITSYASRVCSLLFLVTRCVEHFRGAVVQVAHDCIVAQFIRHEDTESEWEDAACRSAFAIQKLCDEHSPPLKSRMAIVAGRAVLGSSQFHVSRMYTAISPALMLGLRLLPLTDLHDCDIVTEVSIVNRLPNRFLTRPIQIMYPLDLSVRGGGPTDTTTVYQVVLEEPDEDAEAIPDLEEVRRTQRVIKDVVKAWEHIWTDYEKVVLDDAKPTAAQLESLYLLLDQFKLFKISKRDMAYEMVLGAVRQLAFDINVTLTASVEDE